MVERGLIAISGVVFRLEPIETHQAKGGVEEGPSREMDLRFVHIWCFLSNGYCQLPRVNRACAFR